MVHGQGGFRFQNWAKTYGSSPELYFQPTTVEEIKEILALARQKSKKVKVVGGGHSPSDIACTDDFMIQMGKMDKILKVDKEKKQVTVEAGVFLCDLNVELSKYGLALPILGAVSDVSAAGIIGTGTHNTGIKHGIVATQSDEGFTGWKNWHRGPHPAPWADAICSLNHVIGPWTKKFGHPSFNDWFGTGE